MSGAICVADLNAGAGVARGVFSCAMPNEGCPALLIVNLNEVKTLAQLTSALAALPAYDANQNSVYGGPRPPQQSPRALGVKDIGPFASCARPIDPNILAFWFKPGWSSANVAASMHPYGMGSIGGQHAVALITNHSHPGGSTDAGRPLLIAGAIAALTGVLP